ncbi:hypothetical protein OROGR_021045 [Orobanche gracilis]
MLFYKSALFLCGCLSVKNPIYRYMHLTSLPKNPPVDDYDNSVIVERNASSRTAIINRPYSLNALNVPMVTRLQKLYRNWEDNRDIGFVVLKGRGRAFCAGGDVVSIYNLLGEGKVEECKELFWKAYSLIHNIGTYPKPQVAILHGTTMGGGAGISVTGMFRVATDKTIFATPETLIGFHPDGGASFYLSRLPGYLGEYLALTGDKLNGAEMRSCGLATHYLLNTKLSSAEKKLVNLVTGDPSSIENCLARFEDSVRPDPDSVVHRCSLENEAAKTNNAWCVSTLEKLKRAPPLSLKVSLRSIREGRFQSLEQCLIREYRMTVQAISMQITRDFYEGWDPPSLDHVSQDMVDHYFSPITQFEPDLELPTKKSELLTQVPIVVP